MSTLLVDVPDCQPVESLGFPCLMFRDSLGNRFRSRVWVDGSPSCQMSFPTCASTPCAALFAQIIRELTFLCQVKTAPAGLSSGLVFGVGCDGRSPKVQ